MDNGAYTSFPEQVFMRLMSRQTQYRDNCLFVVCPDVVGNARLTLERFKRRHEWIPAGWPIAFVAQDGQEDLELPWNDFDVLFVGGKDPWKTSQAASDLVREATRRGKRKHAGRVNTLERFLHFQELEVETCDGSGIARYDHMLHAIESRL